MNFHVVRIIHKLLLLDSKVEVIHLTNASLSARDVQGLPLLAQPAPIQSYAPMAGKPPPFRHLSH